MAIRIDVTPDKDSDNFNPPPAVSFERVTDSDNKITHVRITTQDPFRTILISAEDWESVNAAIPRF